MLFRRTTRTLLAGLVTLMVGVSIGGCALLPRGGQTAEQAQAAGAGIPGVVTAEVSAGGAYSGFVLNSLTRVNLVLADGYEVADADKLVSWAVATGWSVNDPEPNVGVVISLKRLDGTEVDWAWEAAVERFGVNPDTVRLTSPGGRENLSYSFAFSDLERLLGGWPGPVPETPEGIFERVGDTVDVAP